MQAKDDLSLTGLLGEDPDSQGRRRRQQEQLRDWLLQQQREQAAARQQSKLQGEVRIQWAQLPSHKHTLNLLYLISRAAP